jgi:hypothetical protein
MIDKTLLKKTILSLEADKLAYSERAHAEYLQGAKRDTTEPFEHGEASQEYESADIAQSFEGSIHSYGDAIDAVERIDFGPKTEVAEGAALRLSGRWYVIAVSTSAFDCAGVAYMGISTDAPIYSAIEGRRRGDSVSFGGRNLEVEEVL